MPELKYATLLMADRLADGPAGTDSGASVRQTQILGQAQWRQLLIQTHREPGSVGPTLMKPVPEVQLILRRAGVSRMTLTAGGHVRRLQPRPGDLFLTAAHQPPYEMQRESLCGQPIENTHLYLSRQLLAQTAAETLGVNTSRLELREGSCLRDPLLRQLTLALGRELHEPTVGGSLFAETAAQLVAVQLLRQHGSVRYAVAEPVGKLAPGRLRQLTEYVQAHLAQAITLQELAAVACLSAYHFCRIFKRSTGLSPQQYVTGQRLAKAQELLRAGRSPAHVGYAVGYGNPRHFTQAFRRQLGCTPTQYQQRLRTIQVIA